MNLIQRYIFRKTLGAVVLISMSLGLMIWLSQALREFSIVTLNGQALTTFLELSAFLLPVLVAVIVPVTVMIGVIYALSAMNTDSELVIINAAGTPQWTILKPTLLAATLAALLVWSMTLYISPAASRSWTLLMTSIRGDVIANLVHEGTFVQIAPGLTFHMRSRNRDGSFNGVFVSDYRDPDESNTYLAERGTVIENALGTFMIMNNGTIQQRSKTRQSIQLIEFTSYAFDLSSFTATGSAAAISPNERTTAYLFNPDPDDPVYRNHPGSFAAELTDRFVSPLYCLVFALVPLLYLGHAQSNRQSRTAHIVTAAAIGMAFRIAPYFLPTADSVAARIAAYAFPLALIVTMSVMYLRGVQLSPPARLVAAGEFVFARAGSLLRGRSRAVAH